MRFVTKGAVLFAAAALIALPLRVALAAQVTPEAVQGHFADETVRPNLTAGKGPIKSATNVLTTIYDNTSASALVAISSTDLASQWGDELFTTGTGVLSTHKFTIFNSGSSPPTGNLLTATVLVSFFDAVTSLPLGSYSTNVNFGAGLPTGFFSIVTVTALDPLLILLPTTDIIAIQQVTAKTGAANRLGVVSMGPNLVGASPPDMFINSSTIGPAGFYILGPNGNPPADPGHFLAVNPPPVSTHSKTWGSLKKLYQ
jgi:hypothetical protein